MTEHPNGSNADRDVEEILHQEDGTHPRIELLHRIATEFAECSTETAIYDTVITAAKELFDVRYAVVLIRNDDRWITITSSPPTTDARVHQVPITGSRLDEVIDRNETVIIDDIGEGIDDASFDRGQAFCTPIGEAGMLQLVTDDDGFDEDNVHYVELLSWIVEARLDRLTLNDEVDSMEEQLYAFADFQQDVLERASHELRTPLTSILGYMEMLADEDVGSLTQEQKSLSQLVLRKATELDAALETLTSAFDGQIADVREEWDTRSNVGQSPVLGAVDGPYLLLDVDEMIADLLAEQLRDIGYDPTIADDPETAREAIRETPPAVIVVDLFTTNGNGIDLAESLCQEEDCEEVTIVVTSILREESTDMPQLGASAYLPDDPIAVVDAAATLLGVSEEERTNVLLFDTTPVDDRKTELPKSWEVTYVSDLDGARTAHREGEYDLAIVRTDGLSDDVTESKAVRVLREHWKGRRLPVMVTDRSREGTEPQYTIGGKLFVQRPLNAADLASTLISTPASTPRNSSDNSCTEVTDR